MAVNKKVYSICEKYFTDGNKKIAELGCQYVMGDEWGGYGPPYFKNVFNHLDITSFDINGENGAVVVNLSDDVPDEYRNKFDIVTNFGTTEHVKNQYVCWKNIFDMTRLDGIVISEIPKKGSWAGHCKYYFDESTFHSLNKDFSIVEMMDVHYDGTGNLIYCVLKKMHSGSFKTSEKELLNNMLIIQDFDDFQGY